MPGRQGGFIVAPGVGRLKGVPARIEAEGGDCRIPQSREEYGRMQNDPIEKFRTWLAARGKRLTREREAVFNETLSHECFTVEQLVNQLSSRHEIERVSRATTYRVLDDMVRAGLLRITPDLGDHEQYFHNFGSL